MRRSAFEAGHGHGLGELLLDDEVEQEYGQGDDGGGGRDGVPALLGEGMVEGEGDGQGVQLVVADDEEGPEEGVPGPIVLFGVLRAESQRSVFCAENWSGARGIGKVPPYETLPVSILQTEGFRRAGSGIR